MPAAAGGHHGPGNTVHYCLDRHSVHRRPASRRAADSWWGDSTTVFYWLAKFVLLGPLLRGLWRPWAEGLANIPDDRPAILASNHLSFCDSFFMPIMVKRKV